MSISHVYKYYYLLSQKLSAWTIINCPIVIDGIVVTASLVLSGSVMISEGVDIPEVVLEEGSPHVERIPFPEGLLERHPTIGRYKTINNHLHIIERDVGDGT
jgi:hypothetical protein